MELNQEKLHARAIMNRGSVLDSEECGCFFCLHKFKPGAITDWGKDDSTAVCPFCGVQAVIPNCPDYDFSDALLLQMKEYWF